VARRLRAHLRRGGIGVYLLSHTINNDTTHLPTSFEFGSHVGAGLRVGARREATVGIALQHLSNAGIKQPNGGVNFVLLNASFPF
jgi:lipid A 3-O-deacylase